jgi:Bacteriophage T4-like portal protein (Gp20)
MAERSIAGDILSLLGITGGGVATSNLAPRVSTPEEHDRAYDRFVEDSKVANPDVWSYYNASMRLPTSFDEMLRLWQDMSTWDLLAAALVEVVDEALQPDSTAPSVLWYECNDSKVEDELNERIVEKLDIETVLPSQAWHTAAFGNHFEKISYAQGEGVLGLTYAHPMDVRRYWLAKNRQCVGFRWNQNQAELMKPDKDSLWRQGDKVVPHTELSASGQNTEELWYPWDFMHIRRMYRLRMNEHGEPIFDEAAGIYKKLRLAIDQMVVHRAQIQPDRYVVNIDTQEQPPVEQMRTIQRWKQSMRAKMSFGWGGTVDQQGQPNAYNTPSDFRSYYNALSLDTVFWMARPKGFQHTIDKLAGTATVPDVYDIEMLVNLFFSIIGMPKSWLGLGGSGGGEGGNQPASGKALLAQDARFYRKVKALRRPITNAYTWLAYFHCLLTDKNITNLDIRAKMSDIGTLEDQMKLEMLEKQVDILQKLGDVIDKYKLPQEVWLEVIFKKYMHLPSEVIDAFMTQLPEEARSESLRAKPPATKHLLEEIERKVNGSRYLRTVVEDLRQVVFDDRASSRRSLARHGRVIFESQQTRPDRFSEGIVKAGDLVVSSFGQLESFAGDVKKAAEPAYRAWSPLSAA